MDDTRQRILTATNELFRRHGYNATSLSKISEASGATIGSIYHFFSGGKEELAAAVIAETGDVYRELFEVLTAADPDVAVAFSGFFDAAAITLSESDYIDPCPIGTVAREVASTNDRLRQATDLVFRSWVDAARARLESGGLPPDLAGDHAASIVMMIEGGFVLSRAGRSPEPMHAAGRTVAALLRDALRSVDVR